MVLIRPSETVRIIKRFHDYADPVNPYMFHCHILEHEDVGMMGQFVVEDSEATAVEEESVPSEASLALKSYPNPFNNTTTILFTLSEASHIRLTVYDALGRQVERVADGRYGVGTHAVIFNGSSLPAGLYVYRLEMPDGRSLTGKLVHME